MENEKQRTLKELSSDVIAYFESIPYSKSRIKQYTNHFKQIAEFMENTSVLYFSPSVGKDFIISILQNRPYQEQDKRNKELIRCANVLSEFQTTGTVQFRSIRKTLEFTGEFGSLILDFIKHRKTLGLAEDTLTNNKLYLHRFLEHLCKNNVTSILSLENRHILGFINSLGFYKKPTIHCILSSLRAFLRFLYEKNFTNLDLAYLIPKDNYNKESKLPTTYTKEEIDRLIKAVERSSPKGKRDVAMILLAARLGLRASDICGLKFSNIQWETNSITLIQKKTQTQIELPILEEVGNAIIDYLKYGRPTSDLPYVFIRVGPPYCRLEEATLQSIVSFYLNRAGIEHLEDKKQGPHALRHSLAAILLEQKTPLPVIAKVLGHDSTESTMSYLRIDLNSLRQCAIEVPSLFVNFYGRRCK